MAHHFLLSVPFDLAKMEASAERDQNPRHLLYDVANRLDANVHVPDVEASRVDKVMSKLYGKPIHWALARRASKDVSNEDIMFCAGDDIGIPFVIMSWLRRRRPTTIVWYMAPARARTRLLTKVLRLKSRIDVFVVNSQLKVDFLTDYLHVSDSRVFKLREQTDARFFTPGAPLRISERPLVFSAGKEQRDYTTLAQATQSLPVDVVVCAMSPTATDKKMDAPAQLPSNMQFLPLDWPDYRQAFRDASVVVVSLLDNNYSAGLTTLVEAMACGRPTVVTRTPGLTEELAEAGVTMGVAPREPDQIHAAINRILEDPDFAQDLGKRAHDYVMANLTSEIASDELVMMLGSFGAVSVGTTNR